MPQPTRSDVQVNRLLTSFSIAWTQEPNNFVADKVIANVPVMRQADRYLQYNQDDWWRLHMRKRPPSTESAGGGWELDNTATYYADVWSLHKDIDDQIRPNAENMINLDRDATAWLTEQAMLRREAEFVTAFFGTSIWAATDQTGVASSPAANQFLQWNDANSTPIQDVRAQIIAMAKRTGRKPTDFVMNPEVWGALVDHPLILDRVKYTQKGVISEDLIAALFGVPNVMTAWGAYESADEDVATSKSFFFPKAAVLLHKASRPSLMTPSAGYIMSWTGYVGAGAMGQRILTFRMNPIRSDRVEIEMAFDMKKIAADLGKYFTAAVA